MADTKISALPASTTPLAGTEVLPIVQGGATKQVSVANLTAGRAVSATELTLSTGNLIIGTAGKGIDFSADPSAAGMTNELLDDYEEGTWTPSITLTSGSVALNATLTKAAYTKIGRSVSVTGYIYIDTVNIPSGEVRVLGLPFAPAGSGVSYEFRASGSARANGLQASATTATTLVLYPGDASLYIEKFAAGVIGQLGADLKADSTFILSATYMTN